jgi:hypothetical protein
MYLPQALASVILGLRGKPFQCLACDGLGHGMATIELPVADLVSGAFELGNDPSAAAVDWQHVVVHPVRNEDARGSLPPRWCREAWRERKHVREEVPTTPAGAPRAAGFDSFGWTSLSESQTLGGDSARLGVRNGWCSDSGR